MYFQRNKSRHKSKRTVWLNPPYVFLIEFQAWPRAFFENYKPFVSEVSDIIFKGVAFGILGLVLFDFWEIRNLTRINTVSHFCYKTFIFF